MVSSWVSRSRSCLFGSWLLGMVACGGSDASFHSSLPGSEELSSLTPSQSEAFCGELVAYEDKELPSMDTCRAQGAAAAADRAEKDGSLSDAALVSVCQDARKQCLDGQNSVTTNECKPFSSSCHATIAEASACLDDWVPFLRQQVDASPVCESLTRSGLVPFQKIHTQDFSSAACATAQTKCPDDIDVIPN